MCAPSGSLDTFGTVAVKNVPIEKWDESYLGIEPNNLKALSRPLGTVSPPALPPTETRVHGYWATRPKSFKCRHLDALRFVVQWDGSYNNKI